MPVPAFAGKGSRGNDGTKKARASKRLRKSRLFEDAVRGVSAHDTDGNRKSPIGDWALPDFVAAFALPDERATSLAQQVTNIAIVGRSHSGGRDGGLALDDQLNHHLVRLDARMIVRQQIEGLLGRAL